MGTMILFWSEGNMQEWYEGEHKANDIVFWVQSKISEITKANAPLEEEKPFNLYEYWMDQGPLYKLFTLALTLGYGYFVFFKIL